MLRNHPSLRDPGECSVRTLVRKLFGATETCFRRLCEILVVLETHFLDKKLGNYLILGGLCVCAVTDR